MKEIELTQGQKAIIDDADYELVSKFKWYAIFDHTSDRYYARTNIRRPDDTRGGMVMHRLVLYGMQELDRIYSRTPVGPLIVDHINFDTLNNVRDNLREVSNSESVIHKNYIRNMQKYRGTRYCPKRNRWRAEVHVNKKRYRSNYFRTEEEAALAYNELARKYHGEYAMLNEVTIHA